MFTDGITLIADFIKTDKISHLGSSYKRSLKKSEYITAIHQSIYFLENNNLQLPRRNDEIKTYDKIYKNTKTVNQTETAHHLYTSCITEIPVNKQNSPLLSHKLFPSVRKILANSS